MKKHLLFISTIAFLLTGSYSCVNDLNVTPIDPNMSTAESVYQSESDFLAGLSKLYGNLAVTGQIGPAGDADIASNDEGANQYWRTYWIAQELPTDEAINGWADAGVPEMSQMTWTEFNYGISALYYRIIIQVTYANEFIRQANTNAKPEYTNLSTYVAEARFLRALAYWHALDLFGNGVPFVVEDDPVGSIPPKPAGTGPVGSELFNYIESELIDITSSTGEQTLNEPRAGYIGAANKAAAWMLLAKLYLNHKDYLGKEDIEYYTKGRDQINNIISKGGYSLSSNYEHLFLADNHTEDNELIFLISQDGQAMKNYGGTTYLVNASIGGDKMIAKNYGTTGNWGGNRVTKALVNKFDPVDTRAMWYTNGQSLEITDQTEFTHGYACVKYKNLNKDGTSGSNVSEGFADIDIPVFRLADAYLMLAEFDMRIDGAVSASALGYINELRTRGGISTPLNASDIDLQFILDERARELYWEAHRRTDLRRFGLLTSGEYVWSFKGNDPNGIAVAERYNWLPIPNADLNANPNLKQNMDY